PPSPEYEIGTKAPRTFAKTNPIFVNRDRATKQGQSPLRARPPAAPRLQLDRAVRNDEPEGRPDRALDQADLAAVGAHELGRDPQPEPGAAGAVRALERLEHMRARLRRDARAGVGDLDHHHGALAPAGDADLVAAGVARGAALERLHGVA